MKNFFKNKEFQLDEILFEGRNREYGAYALRNESDTVLTRALFYGVGLFITISAVPFVINHFTAKQPVIQINDSGPFVIKNIPIDEVKEPDPGKLAQPPKTTSFDSRVPTPSHTVTKEKPAAKTSDYEKAAAGTENSEGKEPISAYTPPITQPGTAVVPVVVAPPVTPDPPKDRNKIETSVDVEAAFAGGVDAFRNKVQSNFDISAFEGSGDTIKTVVTFVVERDGTISNVKATGPDAQFNREAERTVKRINGRWSPAKLGGEAVRSYFKFPITMAFE